jgi:hypothetical protein
MSIAIATMGKFVPVGFSFGGGGGAPPVRSIAEESETSPYTITVNKVYFEEVDTIINVKLLDDF